MSRKRGVDRQASYLGVPKNKNEFANNNYVRISRKLYESPAFRSLTPTARDVYIGLVLQCGREDSTSRMHCKLPKSQFEKIGFAEATFYRAVKQLDEAGFIVALKYHGKRPSDYRLSDEWKNKKTPIKLME